MADKWNPEQYERFKNERSQPFFDLMALLENSQGTNQAEKAESLQNASQAKKGHNLQISNQNGNADNSQSGRIRKAIDLGCGTGELTRILHEKFQIGETLGVDSSAKMIEKAIVQGKISEQTLPSANETRRLRFEIGDIENFSAVGQYDLIFSNAALQWCGDHENLFTRLKRALKPGGQLLVQMPMNFDYPTHTVADDVAATEPFHSLLNDPRGEAGRAVLAVEKYASLLHHLGFREQNVMLKVYPHVLPDREQVIEWVKGTMLTSFEKRLSAADFARFLAAYREALFKKLPDEKPFFYPFKRILMWAR
jgi:trans-aconitate 2-methyltransferase